jgi:hypothetical protein
LRVAEDSSPKEVVGFREELNPTYEWTLSGAREAWGRDQFAGEGAPDVEACFEVAIGGVAGGLAHGVEVGAGG